MLSDPVLAPTMSEERLSIATFGEALWDALPKGIFMGGAPMNVAYHLSRHNLAPIPISAVGVDFLGKEYVRRVAEWGIDTRSIALLPGRLTGTVRGTLDAAGNATYRIVRDVAWDHIPVLRALLRRPAPVAVVYGTLALRSLPNRRALAELFHAWPRALRVLDLNLRPPFDGNAAVSTALRHAQIVKLNDEELAALVGRRQVIDALENTTRRFAVQNHLTRVCISAGARGAGLLWDGAWYWEKARLTKVRDTVGAGDAFLAALLAALLARKSEPAAALACACRVGEFVAAADGATPAYTVDRRGRPSPLTP